jgi:hypothetical protein
LAAISAEPVGAGEIAVAVICPSPSGTWQSQIGQRPPKMSAVGSLPPCDRLYAVRMPLCISWPVCYSRTSQALSAMFPGSSVVEQPAVNRLVAGSNPARGAKQFQRLSAASPTEKFSLNRGLATLVATFCRLLGLAIMMASNVSSVTARNKGSRLWPQGTRLRS